MTEPTDDQIRDLLGRAMADAPEPHTWADVERRAAIPNGPSSAPRRTGVWLAAACVIAVIAGFVVVIDSDDNERIRTDDDTIPTTTLQEELTPPQTIPSTTTAPATTSASTTTSTTTPEDGPVWRGGLLDDIDVESFRPLGSVGVGDLIVPTAPTGWRLSNLTFTAVGDDPATREWDGSNTTIIEARPDGTTGAQIELSLSRPGSTQGLCAQLSPDLSQSGCATSGSSVEINGVTWQSFAELEGISADAGDVWIEVLVQDFDLQGPVLDDPRIVTYLESLRVGSTDDYFEIAGEIGQACWGCGDLDASAEPESTPVGDIDRAGLRPLSTLSSGDIVIPTAPPEWDWGSSISIIETPDGPVQNFDIWSNEVGGTLRVETYACDDTGGEVCEVPALESVPLPLVDTIEIDDNTWGYSPGGFQPTAVIGDHVVVIAVPVMAYNSDVPLLEEPNVLEIISGLRVTTLADVPDTIAVSHTDPDGIPVDPTTGARAPRVTVASYDVRGSTLLVNAAIVEEEVCVTLDRADTGETVYPAHCRERSDFEQNLSMFVAEVGAGPTFDPLPPGEQPEALLVGYVDSPTAVDVRARAPYSDQSVDGRSAGPSDVVEGVFVVMPVNELWPPEDGVAYGTFPVQLEIIEPAG